MWACRGVRLRRDEMAPAVRGPVGLAIAFAPLLLELPRSAPPSATRGSCCGCDGAGQTYGARARTPKLTCLHVSAPALLRRCCCRMGRRSSLALQALVALVCLTVVSGQFFVNLNDKNKVLAMCVCTQMHRRALHPKALRWDATLPLAAHQRERVPGGGFAVPGDVLRAADLCWIKSVVRREQAPCMHAPGVGLGGRCK